MYAIQRVNDTHQVREVVTCRVMTSELLRWSTHIVIITIYLELYEFTLLCYVLRVVYVALQKSQSPWIRVR